MNNLAASLAQHPAHAPYALVPAAFATSEDKVPPTVPSTRREFLEAAERWARNASDLAAGTPARDRSQECDEACAVVLCNLSDVLEALGRPSDARTALKDALQLGTRLGLGHVVERAEQRILELDDRPKASSG